MTSRIMDIRFKDTQVIVWDFDKTLYRPNLELEKAICEAEIATLMEYKQCDRQTASGLLSQWFPQKTLSTTNAIAKICGFSVAQSAQIIEAKFDRRTYLQRDEKIITLFAKLNRYMHFILANGNVSTIKETLETIGLRIDLFREIVTAETVGVNKPELLGFDYILKRTRIAPAEHIMIGDRIEVDLVPAKAIGMKTGWIYWNSQVDQVNDAVADICVPTVYDLEQVLV